MSRRIFNQENKSLFLLILKVWHWGGLMYKFLGVIFDTNNYSFIDHIEIRDRIDTEKNVSHMINKLELKQANRLCNR